MHGLISDLANLAWDVSRPPMANFWRTKTCMGHESGDPAVPANIALTQTNGGICQERPSMKVQLSISKLSRKKKKEKMSRDVMTGGGMEEGALREVQVRVSSALVEQVLLIA